MSDRYLVRSSWDTGCEDHFFPNLPAARAFLKRELTLLYGHKVKDPEKWVKIYRLEEEKP